MYYVTRPLIFGYMWKWLRNKLLSNTFWKFVTVILSYFRQDAMNELFSDESECDRGTLSQLKNYFNHKSVKKNVMQNYSHVVDLFEVSAVWQCENVTTIFTRLI